MKIKKILLVIAGYASMWDPLMAATGDPQALSPGQIAPPDVVQQIQNEAPVRIGSTSVRPLPERGLRALSAGASQSTLVARSTDNLIGVSANELVVIEKDTNAVQLKVAELTKDAVVKAYADGAIVVVRVKRFSDLQPLQQGLAKAFPGARFDLPVEYFEIKAN